MLLHSLGQRLKKDTAGFGKGVAEEDGVGDGSCVTSSPHPSHLLGKKFIHPSFPLFDMLLRKPSDIFLASPFLQTTPGTLHTVVRIIPDES